MGHRSRRLRRAAAALNKESQRAESPRGETQDLAEAPEHRAAKQPQLATLAGQDQPGGSRVQVALLVVAIIGAVIYGLQLRAMQDAVEATRQQAELTATIGEAQLRGWLLPTGIGFNGGAMMWFQLENVGPTPVRLNAIALASGAILPGDCGRSLSPPEQRQNPFVPGGRKREAPYFQVDKLSRGDFVYGYATYHDSVFPDRKRTTLLCAQKIEFSTPDPSDLPFIYCDRCLAAE